MLDLGATVLRHGATPMFFMVSDRQGHDAFFGQAVPDGDSRALEHALMAWFTELPPEIATENAAEYRAFLNACAERRFEVVFVRAE